MNYTNYDEFFGKFMQVIKITLETRDETDSNFEKFRRSNKIPTFLKINSDFDLALILTSFFNSTLSRFLLNTTLD